jgi:hypothetical protein
MVHIYSLKEEYEIFKKSGELSTNRSGCVLFKRIRELGDTIELSESQISIKPGEDFQSYVIRLQHFSQAMKPLFNYQDLNELHKEFDFLNSEVGVIETFCVSSLLAFALTSAISSFFEISFIFYLLVTCILVFVSVYYFFALSLEKEQQARIINLIELLKDHLRIYKEVITMDSVNTTSCKNS